MQEKPTVVVGEATKKTDYDELADFVEDHGVALNILPNARLGLWSNSGLGQGANVGEQSAFEIAAADYDEDAEGADDSGNWAKTDCTLAQTNDVGNGAGGSDNYYTITETGATQGISQALSGLTVGKLYKFSIWIKNGTGTWATSTLAIKDNALVNEIASVPMATQAAWYEYSIIFVAAETNPQMVMELALGGGLTAKWDDAKVIEVQPGCVAADTLALDGWWKTATLDIVRIQQDTTHCKGFYGIKITKGVNGTEYLYAGNSSVYNKPYFYQKFLGKTVTFGCWVYSVSKSVNVILRIADSVGSTEASAASADSLQWIEVTHDVDASATYLVPVINLEEDSGDVAYISEPVLVIGTSIGEGNWIYQPKETILAELVITSHEYTSLVSQSDFADREIVIEADSSGKIPKGCKAVHISLVARDSGSAANLVRIVIGDGVTEHNMFMLYLGGLANDSWHSSDGWVKCDANGNIEIDILNASGGNTLDMTDFKYFGVQF